MTNILLVMTGGTIGSVISENSIIPIKDRTPLVLDMFKKRYGDYDTSFTVKMPFMTLSENMTCEHFQLIYNTVKEEDNDSFDGVIITCGTDTLDYTSAAAGLTLGNIGKSVAVVSSDKVLSDETANGLSNFKNAVDFIKDGTFAGAYTFYTQNGEENVHIATRITPCLNFTDRVETVDGNLFAVMENGKPVLKTDEEIKINPKWKDVNFKFTDNVLFIKGYPSMNPKFYNFKDQKPCAIVYSLYHSSTASTEGEKSAVALLKTCKESGIDFYVAPYRSRNTRYITDEELIAAGAKPLYDMSETTVLVKVMLAYGTFSDIGAREEFLKDTVFCEKIIETVID